MAKLIKRLNSAVRHSPFNGLQKCLCLISFADEPFLAKRLSNPSTADLSSLLNRSKEVNDNGDEEYEGGSGVNPGPDAAVKKAVMDIVGSVRDKII